MCILIAKASNARKMTTTEIRNTASNNPDGFGMAWVQNKKIHTLHTFNVEEIIKQNDSLPDSTAVIYHFRIATHGSVNIRNCHPFVSDDDKIAFAHNGVLTIANEKDKTDSETAFQRIIMPNIIAYGKDSEQLTLAVNTIIGTSKFALLFADGTLKTYGNFATNDNGLLFSNNSHTYDRQSMYDFDTSYYNSYYCASTKKGNKDGSKSTFDSYDRYDIDLYYDEYLNCENEMRMWATAFDYKNFYEPFVNEYSLLYTTLTEDDYEEIYYSIMSEQYELEMTNNYQEI